MKLGIYSGKCFQGIVGTPANLKDAGGERLYVGDIVLIHHDDYPRSGLPFATCDHLTAVVDGRYTTYSDGKIVKHDGTMFVMGIKDICDSCKLNSDKWFVTLVKSHKHVIDGEHWEAYGFNYKKEYK